MILYDYFRSTACYRVRLALNIKGLEYDIEAVHLINNGGEQYSEGHVNTGIRLSKALVIVMA